MSYASSLAARRIAEAALEAARDIAAESDYFPMSADFIAAARAAACEALAAAERAEASLTRAAGEAAAEFERLDAIAAGLARNAEDAARCAYRADPRDGDTVELADDEAAEEAAEEAADAAHDAESAAAEAEDEALEARECTAACRAALDELDALLA